MIDGYEWSEDPQIYYVQKTLPSTLCPRVRFEEISVVAGSELVLKLPYKLLVVWSTSASQRLVTKNRRYPYSAAVAFTTSVIIVVIPVVIVPKSTNKHDREGGGGASAYIGSRKSDDVQSLSSSSGILKFNPLTVYRFSSISPKFYYSSILIKHPTR